MLDGIPVPPRIELSKSKKSDTLANMSTSYSSILLISTTDINPTFEKIL